MCCREQIFGCDGIESLEKCFFGERFAIMKVTFRHSDGYVFEVVVRNTDLPLELTAGSVEGALGERMLCEFVQFVGNESAASGTIICVATIVNRPDARIGIGRVVALDGIDQSVAFAQGEVQAAAHGRAAQHVAEEIKVQLARVAGSESLRSDDDVRLVRALVPYNVKIPARGVGNPRTRRLASPHAAFFSTRRNTRSGSTLPST